MVTTNISISTTIENIKKITDLTLLNPKDFDKMKMSKVLHKTQENITICIPMESDYYWLKVIQFVRQKSQKWIVKLSDDFISNELQSFIYQLKTNKKKYGNIGKSVKEWLEALKKIPITNFRFILPVNHVDYRKDLDLGRIKLQKITLRKLKKLATFDKTGLFSARKVMADMTTLNETEIFAIIEVQAKDQNQGMIFANLSLKRLIYAMRLFDPPSGITNREEYFPPVHFHYLIVNLDRDSLFLPNSNLHLNAHVWRTKEYWKRVNPDWNTLKKFLFSSSLNEVQSTILNALYWYGDAGREMDDDLSKFLKYTYGLENCVIFDNQYDKKNRMASRLSTIIGSDRQTQIFWNDLLKQYYDVRSGAIHSGKLVVEKEDVNTTHKLLRDLIFRYIRLSKKYTDLKTMFKTEFAISI